MYRTSRPPVACCTGPGYCRSFSGSGSRRAGQDDLQPDVAAGHQRGCTDPWRLRFRRRISGRPPVLLRPLRVTRRRYHGNAVKSRGTNAGREIWVRRMACWDSTTSESGPFPGPAGPGGPVALFVADSRSQWCALVWARGRAVGAGPVRRAGRSRGGGRWQPDGSVGALNPHPRVRSFRQGQKDWSRLWNLAAHAAGAKFVARLDPTTSPGRAGWTVRSRPFEADPGLAAVGGRAALFVDRGSPPRGMHHYVSWINGLDKPAPGTPG
ncbi:MAG: hypothetical protein Ct9H300mP16_04650 [Pseudomonadota bacterium]|nr:MAG: hypothetical protein Ct9H300mP16_04650 [Pseudomonadota bacterium]